jgi:hypothetical protein
MTTNRRQLPMTTVRKSHRQTKFALPRGWAEHFSNSQQRTYWWHKETNRKQWHFPKAGDELRPAAPRLDLGDVDTSNIAVELTSGMSAEEKTEEPIKESEASPSDTANEGNSPAAGILSPDELADLCAKALEPALNNNNDVASLVEESKVEESKEATEIPTQGFLHLGERIGFGGIDANGIGDPDKVTLLPIDTKTDEAKVGTPNESKRFQQKRLVGNASKTINQMKDVTVKQVTSTAVTAVKNIQLMNTYDTETKNANNPSCDTLLINFDEIIPVPREGGDGEKKRKVASWTILAPNTIDPLQLGQRLESLGRQLMNPKKKDPKSKKDGFVVNVFTSPDEYMAEIFGNKAGNSLEKRKRYKG